MTVKSGVMGCAALLGVLMAGQVLAACERPAVVKVMDFSVCKDWPAFPGLTLTAVANFSPDPMYGESDRVGTYDLGLSVLSTDSPEPLATYRLPSAYMSDAIAVDDLQLDTARYKLTPELQAFGVRVRFRGSSRVNPVDETLLSLYVKEGSTLRPVMDRFVVYQFGGEWDGGCAGERYETIRTVELAKTRSHGYADLIVKSVSTSLVGEGEPQSCDVKSTTDKPVLTTLRYDGKAYVLPEGFKGF
ncbi:hypothetical protein [Pseudomonas sp. McL0111]|uniref:hypothetical protein n=1 Tax=Pseudomonas sp. McL0111 TaxID=3457357 RepID=UPI00403E8A74